MLWLADGRLSAAPQEQPICFRQPLQEAAQMGRAVILRAPEFSGEAHDFGIADRRYFIQRGAVK